MMQRKTEVFNITITGKGKHIPEVLIIHVMLQNDCYTALNNFQKLHKK